VLRGVTALMRPTTVRPDDVPPSVGQDLDQWSVEVIATLAPHTPGKGYQKLPNRLIEDWPQLYYAENFERPVEIETTIDPGDLLQDPQSIPPRG
jgi:Berberine and berberine like